MMCAQRTPTTTRPLKEFLAPCSAKKSKITETGYDVADANSAEEVVYSPSNERNPGKEVEIHIC